MVVVDYPAIVKEAAGIHCKSAPEANISYGDALFIVGADDTVELRDHVNKLVKAMELSLGSPVLDASNINKRAIYYVFFHAICQQDGKSQDWLWQCN